MYTFTIPSLIFELLFLSYVHNRRSDTPTAKNMFGFETSKLVKIVKIQLQKFDIEAMYFLFYIVKGKLKKKKNLIDAFFSKIMGV